MKSILASDTPLTRFINRVGVLILLNLCYLLCCIPVITIGAANAALYGTCFRFGTDQQGKPISVFFRLFRSSLKKGTLLWVVLLILLAILGAAAKVMYNSAEWMQYGSLLLMVLLVILVMISWYAFALVGLFDNGIRATLVNSTILCLGYLPRSVLILLVNLLPAIIILAFPPLFLRLVWFWVYVYFSLAGWINAKIAQKAIAPYLPWEAETETAGVE